MRREITAAKGRIATEIATKGGMTGVMISSAGCFGIISRPMVQFIIKMSWACGGRNKRLLMRNVLTLWHLIEDFDASRLRMHPKSALEVLL